ncbi:MAG: hypothetical protein MHM6MM_003092 [Cercozoa sp. M6MM]
MPAVWQAALVLLLAWLSSVRAFDPCEFYSAVRLSELVSNATLACDVITVAWKPLIIDNSTNVYLLHSRRFVVRHAELRIETSGLIDLTNLRLSGQLRQFTFQPDGDVEVRFGTNVRPYSMADLHFVPSAPSNITVAGMVPLRLLPKLRVNGSLTALDVDLSAVEAVGILRLDTQKMPVTSGSYLHLPNARVVEELDVEHWTAIENKPILPSTCVVMNKLIWKAPLTVQQAQKITQRLRLAPAMIIVQITLVEDTEAELDAFAVLVNNLLHDVVAVHDLTLEANVQNTPVTSSLLMPRLQWAERLALRLTAETAVSEWHVSAPRLESARYLVSKVTPLVSLEFCALSQTELWESDSACSSQVVSTYNETFPGICASTLPSVEGPAQCVSTSFSDALGNAGLLVDLIGTPNVIAPTTSLRITSDWSVVNGFNALIDLDQLHTCAAGFNKSVVIFGGVFATTFTAKTLEFGESSVSALLDSFPSLGRQRIYFKNDLDQDSNTFVLTPSARAKIVLRCSRTDKFYNNSASDPPSWFRDGVSSSHILSVTVRSDEMSPPAAPTTASLPRFWSSEKAVFDFVDYTPAFLGASLFLTHDHGLRHSGIDSWHPDTVSMVDKADPVLYERIHLRLAPPSVSLDFDSFFVLTDELYQKGVRYSVPAHQLRSMASFEQDLPFRLSFMTAKDHRMVGLPFNLRDTAPMLSFASIDASDRLVVNTAGTVSPAYTLQSGESVRYRYTLHVSDEQYVVHETSPQTAGETLAVPELTWADMGFDKPLLGALRLDCVFKNDTQQEVHVCPFTVVSEVLGSALQEGIEEYAARTWPDFSPDIVRSHGGCEDPFDFELFGRKYSEGHTVMSLGDMEAAERVLTVTLPFLVPMDFRNMIDAVGYSHRGVYLRGLNVTLGLPEQPYIAVPKPPANTGDVVWVSQLQLRMALLPQYFVTKEMRPVMVLGKRSATWRTMCAPGDESTAFRMTYFPNGIKTNVLTLYSSGPLPDAAARPLSRRPFGGSPRHRRLPPSSRVGFEIIAPSLRSSWLNLHIQGLKDDSDGVVRLFSLVPCDGLCDDVWERRFVTDMSPLDSQSGPRTVAAFADGLTLKVTMNNDGFFNSATADVVANTSYASWPQLFGLHAQYANSYPFAITAARTANRVFTEGCVDDEVPQLCGRYETPGVGTLEWHCLVVSKCPVDTRPSRDWLVLAGAGLDALRHPDIRVMATVKDRRVLQGDEADWEKFESALPSSNRQFGLQLVDLNNETDIDALVDMTDDVKLTLKQMDIDTHFGHGDLIDIDSSTVLVLPVPEGLAQFNLEVGARAVLLSYDLYFPDRTFVNYPVPDPSHATIIGFQSFALPIDESKRLFPLVSYNGAFFVQLKQIGNPQVGGNCELLGNVVQGCSRFGKNRLQLMAFNLETEAFAYGVRLVLQGQYKYSSGNVTIGMGLADSQTIEFDLPSVPQYIEGTDSFELHVLSLRINESHPHLWNTSLPVNIPTGFRVHYRACPTHFEPSATEYPECVECVNGAVSTGGYACVDCEAGTYAAVRYDDTQSQVTRSECIPCDPFTFTDLSGMSQCNKCYGYNTIRVTGDGKYEPVSALATCQECPRGQYSPRAHGAVLGPCLTCPVGADCSDGQIRAEDNFWIDYDADSGRIGAYRCKTGEHCLAGSKCSSVSGVGGEPLPRTCCGPNRELADSNALCGECLDGYYEWGNKCIKCDNDGSVVGNIVLVLFMYFAYVAVVHLLAQNLRDASVRILLYYVQMSKLFAGAIDVSISGWLAKLFFGLFSLDVMAITGGSMCYGRASPMTRIWMSAFTPIFTLGLLGVLLVIKFALNRERFDDTKAAFKRTGLYLLIGSYAAVLDVVIQVVFGCTDAGLDGRQVLKEYPSVSCDSSSYKSTRLALGVVGLVYALGIPAWLLFVMRRRLHRQQLFTLEAQRQIGVLTEVYRPRVYYWEAFVLLRRTLLLIIVFVNVSSDNTEQMLFLSGIATTIFLAVQLVVWPYRRVSDNAMELFVLLAHRVTLLALATAEAPMSQTQSDLFALWMLVSSGLLVLSLVMVKSLEWRHHMQLQGQALPWQTESASLLSRAIASVAECFTCAPLSRVTLKDRSLDQVLSTRLVTSTDFDVFEQGGGDLLNSEVVTSPVGQHAAQFFGGLRTLPYDVFDIESSRVHVQEVALAALDNAGEPDTKSQR